MSVDRFCATCGRPRDATDGFCAGCGHGLAAQPETAVATAPAAATNVPNTGRTQGAVLVSNVAATAGGGSPYWSQPAVQTRQRAGVHPGVVFALVLLTFGLYSIYWFFDTWREIKRHDGDTGKKPIGHALAMFVPIYGLFRLYDHMRTIANIVRSSGGHTTLRPGTALIAWIIANGLFRVSGQPGLGWVLIIGTAVLGAAVAWGQAALNQGWRLQPEGARVRSVHPAEWVVLVIGGLLTAVALFA